MPQIPNAPAMAPANWAIINPTASDQGSFLAAARARVTAGLRDLTSFRGTGGVKRDDVRLCRTTFRRVSAAVKIMSIGDGEVPPMSGRRARSRSEDAATVSGGVYPAHRPTAAAE